MKPDSRLEHAVETGRAVVGVLFVHGIGQQQRGQTLRQCEESTCTWLSQWLGSTIVLDREHACRTAAPSSDPTAPAFAHLYFKASDSKECLSHWLFAESWWAESFEVPQYRDVARWGISILPWSVLAAFGDRLRAIVHQHRFAGLPAPPTLSQRRRLAIAQLPEFLTTLLLCGVVLPIAFAAQIAVLATILVGKMRLLRWSVVRVQRLLSEVVGDTYALLQSDVSFRKMVDQVRKDLRWLSDRCDAVVVVAHSQGSAVTHEALRTERSEGWALSDCRLITFGAAVGRFVGMRALVESSRRAFTAASAHLILTGALNAALLFAVATIGLSPEARQYPSAWYDEMTFYVVIGLFALLMPSATAALLPISLRRLATRHQSQLALAGLANRDGWRDIYATADPIPNGPLLEPDFSSDHQGRDDGIAVTSMQVTNRRNPFRDHTTYWNNPDEFVTCLIATLAPLTGRLRSLIDPPPVAMNAAAHARAHRVSSLNHVRLAALFWTAVVCITDISALYGAQSSTQTSGMRLTLFSWSIAMGTTLAAMLWLWSIWNRRQEHLFLVSHQSSHRPFVGPMLTAGALLLPGLVTYSFGSLRLRLELLTVLAGSIVVLLLLAAIGHVVKDPARPYGPLTGKDGELRRGSVWASCFGLIGAALAWIAWVLMVAGSDDLGGLIGRLIVIDAAWFAFLASSLGFVKGSRLSQCIAVAGLTALIPVFLTYPFHIASGACTIVALACAYLSVRGFDEAARRLVL
ncbi:MAG: hypothetical protein H0W30_17565 [Gemmatimonadaceae bacterium]|nr:hypothetical protein [Gemmatimonadaceae bacterium]MBA3560395.1 hypothetical protein [Gemmatimonadaceae bacterium]